MANDTLKFVAEAIDMEGFDYALRHWSDFEEVKDEKFHELRRAYIDAANALENYLPDLEEEDEEGD